MKRIAIHILTLVVGIVTGLMLARSHVPNSSGFHWRKIAEFNKYCGDPLNYVRQGQLFMTKSAPPEIEQDLEALVASGELGKRQIIIPGLPNIRPHIERWMAFSQDPAIVYGVGPGRFQKGEIPLMFTLWFKPEAKDRVDQLVDEFTKLAQRNPGDAEPQEAEQPGAGQPATKPADKVPAEVQPPTPTPKVRPR